MNNLDRPSSVKTVVHDAIRNTNIMAHDPDGPPSASEAAKAATSRAAAEADAKAVASLHLEMAGISPGPITNNTSEEAPASSNPAPFEYKKAA